MVLESSSPDSLYMHERAIAFFFLSLISPFVFHGRKYVVWVCNTMRVSKWWQNFQFFCELVLGRYMSLLLVDTCRPTWTQIYAHVFSFISHLIFLRHPSEFLWICLIMSFFSFLQFFSVYLPSLFLMLVCSALCIRLCEYEWECVRGGVSARACVFACICVAETYKVKVTPEVICKAS